jgi:hypothetical protein
MIPVRSNPLAAPAVAESEGNAMSKKWSGLVDGLVKSFGSKRHEPFIGQN